jgi:hypothetical protein
MFDDVDEDLLKKMSGYFPDCKSIRDHMASLTSIIPALRKQIAVILDPHRPLEERMEAKEQAQSHTAPFGSSKELNKEEEEFFLAVIEKLTLTHLTPHTIPKMFSYISNQLPEDSDEVPDEVATMLVFLQAVSEVVPEYFAGCYLQLKAMLADENPVLVENALALLSHTAQTLSGQVISK